MGHNVYTTAYPENVDKKSVQDEWDEVAWHDDWKEGCQGLSSNIRWIEAPICEDREAAEAYIEQHDNGWYDQLAVRFKQYQTPKMTKHRQDIEERLSKATQKYNELSSNLHFANAKSQYIGCKHCGSKISNQHLRSNRCPVCGKDLRPATTLQAIANAEKAKNKLEAELKKELSKKTGKPKIMWLVKIEYHT